MPRERTLGRRCVSSTFLPRRRDALKAVWQAGQPRFGRGQAPACGAFPATVRPGPSIPLNCLSSGMEPRPGTEALTGSNRVCALQDPVALIAALRRFLYCYRPDTRRRFHKRQRAAGFPETASRQIAVAKACPPSGTATHPGWRWGAVEPEPPPAQPARRVLRPVSLLPISWHRTFSLLLYLPAFGPAFFSPSSRGLRFDVLPISWPAFALRPSFSSSELSELLFSLLPCAPPSESVGGAACSNPAAAASSV